MPDDLKTKRDEFVQTFFKKGAELTVELVRDNDRLRDRLTTIERENAQLRTQLASDAAIRDLLTKIEQLETEKNALLSNMHEKEAAQTRVSSRYAEIEAELESFANLYVASYQLHSTLRLSAVMRHLKELLMQLVGARSLAFYVRDAAGRALVPITSEGIGNPAPIVLRDDSSGGDVAGGAGANTTGAVHQIERAFLTGVAAIASGDVHDAASGLPVACVPMRFDDQVVGVIVVYALLEQKRGFVDVDHELFKLLGAHAGTALIGAQLYAAAGEKVPSLEALRDLLR